MINRRFFPNQNFNPSFSLSVFSAKMYTAILEKVFFWNFFKTFQICCAFNETELNAQNVPKSQITTGEHSGNSRNGPTNVEENYMNFNPEEIDKNREPPPLPPKIGSRLAQDLESQNVRVGAGTRNPEGLAEVAESLKLILTKLQGDTWKVKNYPSEISSESEYTQIKKKKP